jgi:DNA-binding SARP family transcriptional activator
LTQIQLGVLGTLQLVYGDHELRVGGARQRSVLALLALRHDRIVSVDALVSTVWGDDPPTTSRTQIAICVAALRKLLKSAGCSDDVITTIHPGYRLNTAGHRLDLVEFRELVDEAAEMTAAGRPEEAAEAYRAALALWRGPALAGLIGCELENEAAWLEERRLTVVDEYAELRLSLGRHQELVPELSAMVSEHPLRERTRHALMLAQYRSGRRPDALETFQSGRRLGVQELGLEPGAALQELHTAILREDPALASWQAAAPDEPAAAAPGSGNPPPAAPPSDLPPNVPSFTGRAAETGLLDVLLSERPDSAPPRIALITGVAGVGKTALAVHWAHRAAPAFPDGALFVDLGRDLGLHAPDAAPGSIGDVLGRLLRGLGVSGDMLPDDEGERISLYRTLLRGRRVLIVLDDAPSFAQVRPLLPASGGCCVVVTSREAMEELVLCHGATRISLGVLGREEAAELLGRVVTGDRIASSPEQAGRLAELCDGLPLALCIAAARLATRPHWTVQRLTTRLADERRRLDELSIGESRVRASFALSYRCLTPRAADVYRRLGLLDVPDVAAWAVAALLDCPLDEAEQQLDDLADAHLLEVSGPDATGQLRYRFQNLLRLYARERALEESDQPTLAADRDRALHSWLTVAEAAHRREYGGDHSVIHGPAPRPHVDQDLMEDLLARPLDWFEAERHCLVSVVDQAARLGLASLAWDLAACMAGFSEIRNNTDDWRHVCEQGLAAARAAADGRGEGAMLAELGAVTLYRGELPEAVRLLEEAEAVFRATDDAHGLALTSCKLAVADRQRGRAEQAATRLRQALPVLRAAQDISAQAHALNNLAQLAVDAGETAEAVRLGEESVALARGLGATRGAAQAFHRLGRVLLAADRPAEAEAALLRAAGIVEAKQDRLGLGYVLLGLAEARMRAGRTARAEADLSAGLEHAERAGSTLLLGRMHLLLGELQAADGRTEEALGSTRRGHELFTRAGTRIWMRHADAQRERLSATAPASAG